MKFRVVGCIALLSLNVAWGSPEVGGDAFASLLAKWNEELRVNPPLPRSDFEVYVLRLFSGKPVRNIFNLPAYAAAVHRLLHLGIIQLYSDRRDFQRDKLARIIFDPGLKTKKMSPENFWNIFLQVARVLSEDQPLPLLEQLISTQQTLGMLAHLYPVVAEEVDKPEILRNVYLFIPTVQLSLSEEIESLAAQALRHVPLINIELPRKAQLLLPDLGRELGWREFEQASKKDRKKILARRAKEFDDVMFGLSKRSYRAQNETDFAFSILYELFWKARRVRFSGSAQTFRLPLDLEALAYLLRQESFINANLIEITRWMFAIPETTLPETVQMKRVRAALGTLLSVFEDKFPYCPTDLAREVSRRQRRQ